MRTFCLALTLTYTLLAQPDNTSQRICFIGDGGELMGEKTHPIVDWLKANVNWNDERNAAIYLGDNIYPLGLPMKGEPDYERSRHILDYELSPFMNAKSKAYIIMGNHDWADGKLRGLQRVRNAGRDHSLQLILRDNNYYIVSGAANLSRVKDTREGKLVYHDLTPGTVMPEVSKRGSITTKFYNTNSQNLQAPTFVQAMKPVHAVPAVVSKDTVPDFPDSVLVAANPKLKESFLRNVFVGRNYREEWTTPVKVPVLDVTAYTPTKQGGGKQTRSLRIEDKNGKEWVLRSVQKYPEGAIPPDLQQTFVKDVLADGISASYPFALLSTQTMAQAAGVPYLKRQLVYIPDDPQLGRFRQTFKNTMAILEEHEPDTVKKMYNTDEVVLKIAKDNDDHVDQIAVLRARLLDNFYMDFDRHERQWAWATRDTGKGKIYYPIPKDQDQALFVSQGLLSYLVRQPTLAPELQGFLPKARNIKTFNKPARNFDRFFLNEVTKEQWAAYADTLLLKMTDDVIEKALAQQPKEVRRFHYNDIVKKLEARRTYFKKEMMDYYRFLSKEVNIVGTNQRELFTIDKLPDAKLRLTVNKIDKQGNVSTIIYDRTFDEAETKQLQLYGLEGRDSFVVKGGATPIKIRIIGGPGDDAFVNQSTEGKRIRIYDVNFEENNFSGNVAGFINRIGPDPRLNEYNRLFYKYDYFAPSLQLAYNVDDGLFVGLRGTYLSHGFRKDPFSTRHVFRFAHAVKTSSYFFGYDADFTKAVGMNDLLVRSDVRAPVNVTNFYGIGNNSLNLKKVVDQYYYRIRYNIANVSVSLRKQLQPWMRVNYGLAFQYFDINQSDNRGKFVASSGPLAGVDNATVYKPKFYAGPAVGVDISSKDNVNLPTRGFTLDAGLRSLIGLNEQTKWVTQFHWDMSVFISKNPNPVVVYGLRFGVATNFGDYEIPQAQYLSGTVNLRGFRRDRFAGRTMLYNNTEIRLKLADFNTFLFPGSMGILLFNDVGRVWSDSERSHRYHDGYGGGIWIAPIKRWVASVSLGHSNEESVLPYFNLGFRF